MSITIRIVVSAENILTHKKHSLHAYIYMIHIIYVIYFSLWQFGFMFIALIWKFDFAPFMVLIIAILNDGKILFI